SLHISSIPCSPLPRHLHSFPTRRSSDLAIDTTSCRTSARFGPARFPVRHPRGRMLQRPTGPSHPRANTSIRDGAIPDTGVGSRRSEEHTSELQSLAYLVCRLLLEKKKKK